MDSNIQPDNESDDIEETRDGLCAVCLQVLMHPVALECGHVFCFLCVKGVALQGMHRTAHARVQMPTASCPMCRAPIQPQVLNSPNLVEQNQSLAPSVSTNTTTKEQQDHPVEDQRPISTSHWFYQGRNGWWQYDQRTETEMEKAYQLFIQNIQVADVSQDGESLRNANGSESRDGTTLDSGNDDSREEEDEDDTQGGGSNPYNTCELLIAGFLYTIDFAQMVQHRSNEPHRRRKIKRDVVNNLDGQFKGVAGIRSASRDAGQNAAADSAVDALAQTLERAVTVDDHPSDQNSDQVTTQERDSDTQNR